MKVSVWYNNEDIRIEEVPRPEPGPREILIKVVACGICGSDIVEYVLQQLVIVERALAKMQK